MQFYNEGFSLCVFIVIESGVAIFGPDWWFLKLDNWAKLSSCLNENVAVVRRTSSCVTIATCYTQGQFAGIAQLMADSLHMPAMPSYRFAVGGEVVNVDGGESVVGDASIGMLLKNDVVLLEEGVDQGFAYRYPTDAISADNIRCLVSGR